METGVPAKRRCVEVQPPVAAAPEDRAQKRVGVVRTVGINQVRRLGHN